MPYSSARREVVEPSVGACFVGSREAEIALVGAPYDGTSGGRPRQAKAPALIRQAWQATEANAALPVWDVGDVLAEPVDFAPTSRRLAATVQQAASRAKGPLALLGGEHTVSLAAVEALQPASIVSLDAHPDLWDDQHGRQVAQGTWLRRAIERTGCYTVLPMARAARGSELDAIEDLGVHREFPDELPEPVYLTIDVDVFDPQDAPSVVYPEAEGPSVDEVLELIDEIASRYELVGVDVVEVNAAGPGPTASLGAKALGRALRAAIQPA